MIGELKKENQMIKYRLCSLSEDGKKWQGQYPLFDDMNSVYKEMEKCIARNKKNTGKSILWSKYESWKVEEVEIDE